MANRYRCSACGNLTRFDVVTSRRTRAFHHYTVGGQLRIEDEAVLDEHIEQITCRWCGTGNSIETLDGASLDDGEPGGAGAVTGDVVAADGSEAT